MNIFSKKKQKEVVIGSNLKAELQQFLLGLTYNKLFILTDTNTREQCYPLLQDVPALQNAAVITIQAGDTHKDVEQLSHVWDALSNGGASRDSILLNLGGGMVTDLGGFAAATFKRGIRTINVPTTLMAAVDAAMGGKTGINFNGLKNEIGSFYPPLCVFIDCNFFRTLDQNNLLSGYAEMIKHGLISTRHNFVESVWFPTFVDIDYEYLNELVADSVAVKEKFVRKDPKEKGIRKALNFGHTIGHAIESLSFKRGTPLLHGHAVAVGIVCELYLSYRYYGFPKNWLSLLIECFEEYYPPFFFDCKDYEALYEYMTHDKKNEAGIINFTMLRNIGDIQINQSMNKEQVFESFDFYRESFGI